MHFQYFLKFPEVLQPTRWCLRSFTSGLMLLLLFVGWVTTNLNPWSYASSWLPVTLKMPSCTRLPPVYLSEVSAVGFDPQYLLNLNQEAYTLAHCATAHFSTHAWLAGYKLFFFLPMWCTFIPLGSPDRHHFSEKIDRRKLALISTKHSQFL